MVVRPRDGGWDVNVLVADRSDVRGLEILGARTLDLRAGRTSISRGPERAAGLAVAADLIASDERVHVEVRKTLRSGVTEVALWGDGWPVKLGDRLKLSSID